MPHERFERRSIGRPWRRTQQYQQSTAPAFPAAQPLVPRAPVDLAPGEELTTRTPVRAQSVESDVAVPALQAIMYGVGAALLTVPLAVFVDVVPWYTPLVVFPTVAGGAVFITPRAARKLLMVVEQWTGSDLDGDGEVGEPPAPILVDLTRRSETGRAQAQHLAIPGVKAGEEMQARWFWRICRDGGQGFSQLVAEKYSITRAEVKAVQQYFTSQVPPLATDHGNRVEPNGEGLTTMWGVVERHFPDARLPQGRA